MKRVYYVPSSLSVSDEDNKRSEELSIPLLHGESSLSRYVEFDRQVAQVIYLPSEKICLFSPTVVTGTHQIIEVTNDFVDMRDNVQLVHNGNKIVTPVVLEKHYARYALESIGIGVQVFDIFNNGMIGLEHGEYNIIYPD